tara:strand:+ start:788 stop:1000 length:213 start_codon:yes stop_codon:yes gene_type:complete
MHKNDTAQEIMNYNLKLLGAEVYVIKDGGWRGKVENVVDDEYFLISRFDNPSSTEKVSMYDIRSLSYETF